MTEKSEKLYEAITEFPDELIAEAEEYAFEGQKQKDDRKNRKAFGKDKIYYLKRALAVAACLLLFCGGVVSGILLTESRQQGNRTQTKAEEEKDAFQFLVHNMAMNNSPGSTNSNSSEALMSNYMNYSINSSYTELADLYQLYGITSGTEIEKVVCGKGNNRDDAVTITGKETVEEFFRLTSELERYTVNVFFDTVIDKMSTVEIAAFHEECMTLEITTTNGLVFTLSMYPKSGWLYSGGTMSYYVLSEELLDWYEKNGTKGGKQE